MYYLNLENQLLFLIVLIASSYVAFSAFFMKLEDERLKTFGLSFFASLLFCVLSFIAAPVNKPAAALYFNLSEVLFLFIATLCFLIGSRTVSWLKLPIFLLPILAPVFQTQILTIDWTFYLNIITIIILLIQLAQLIYHSLHKDRMLIVLHLGLFMMGMGQLIFNSKADSLILTLIFTCAGYVLCILYFFRLGTGALEAALKKSNEALHRINSNVQQEVMRRVEEIERTNRKLVEISKTDSMTGLYLKSAVLKILEAQMEKNPNTILSIMMFDIDHFKSVNDTMGHQTGDKCIKQLAAMAQTAFRQDDILGRYGGDEFIILLPGASPVRAYLIADRFRQMVESKSSPKFTISIGNATFPDDGKTVASIIASADKALYVSKQRGRNKVTNFSSIDLPVNNPDALEKH